MDDVGCHGTEESIFDCNYNRLPESSDTHDYDVGIRCQRKGRSRFIYVTVKKFLEITLLWYMYIYTLPKRGHL